MTKKEYQKFSVFSNRGEYNMHMLNI